MQCLKINNVGFRWRIRQVKFLADIGHEYTGRISSDLLISRTVARCCFPLLLGDQQERSAWAFLEFLLLIQTVNMYSMRFFWSLIDFIFRTVLGFYKTYNVFPFRFLLLASIHMVYLLQLMNQYWHIIINCTP